MTLDKVQDIWTASAFFSDGKGCIEITANIIDKIENGELIITEYQNTPLGEILYLSAKAHNN
jgi:hypothetical protein